MIIPSEGLDRKDRYIIFLKIQNTMTDYFLAQRVKLDEATSNKEAYLKKLVLIHQVIVYAMTCKQGTDVENAKKLHQAIDSFTTLYTAK